MYKIYICPIFHLHWYNYSFRCLGIKHRTVELSRNIYHQDDLDHVLPFTQERKFGYIRTQSRPLRPVPLYKPCVSPTLPPHQVSTRYSVTLISFNSLIKSLCTNDRIARAQSPGVKTERHPSITRLIGHAKEGQTRIIWKPPSPHGIQIAYLRSAPSTPSIKTTYVGELQLRHNTFPPFPPLHKK